MVKKKKLATFHLLLIIIGCFVLGGCIEGFEYNKTRIMSASDPKELSREIMHKTIFFSKKGNGGSLISIMELDLQSYHEYQLEHYVQNIDLSQNGKYVTFTHGEYINGNYQIGLWLYDLEEKTETKIAGWEKDVSEIFLSNPSFSHNGDQIIFSVTWLDQGNTGLAIVNNDGSNLKILKTSIPLNEGPEYSPDGSLIIVTCAGMDALSGDPGFQLCLLDKDGQQIRPLTNRGHGHGSYYFTPDGKKIVFSEFEHGGFFGIINKPEDRFYIMDIDGDNKTLLLNWEVGVRGFSDDGKEIIFKGRRDEKSPWGIYIINIDGTNLRHLTYFDEFLEEWYADIEQY